MLPGLNLGFADKAAKLADHLNAKSFETLLAVDRCDMVTLLADTVAYKIVELLYCTV